MSVWLPNYGDDYGWHRTLPGKRLWRGTCPADSPAMRWDAGCQHGRQARCPGMDRYRSTEPTQSGDAVQVGASPLVNSGNEADAP
jgi:hypothetical protein